MEVKARIGNSIGPHEDPLTSVKRRKLKRYGHVTRSSGLAKTIQQGTVQGGRRRGRQRKRREDNIKEWTGLEWNIILRKAKNREEWRKLVVKTTVMPQRSARLRYRCICTCSAQSSMFHMERRFRNTPIIIIIIIKVKLGTKPQRGALA